MFDVSRSPSHLALPLPHPRNDKPIPEQHLPSLPRHVSNPPIPPPSSEHQNHIRKGTVLVFSCIFAMRHDEWVHLGPVRRVSHNPSLLTIKTRPYGCIFWSWKGRDTLKHPQISQRAVLGAFRCSTPILILPYHLPIPLRAPTCLFPSFR